MASNAPVICPVSTGQPERFALCAAATCWMLDGVAYCKCDVMNEPSISIAFNYTQAGQSKNVCDLLLESVNNGFTVSTYATPRQVETDYDRKTEKLGPAKALYTCATKDNADAYGAQCDGGICFNSTQGQKFAELGQLKPNEIICSCPPTLNPTKRFQIAGPWKCEPGAANENNECCDKAFYEDMCRVTDISNTGTRIAVSAPAGSAVSLSTILDGEKPTLNSCRFH